MDCYDTFDEVNHPKLHFHGTFLVLIIPGRCASFFKAPIPAITEPFNGATFTDYPAGTIDKYMSGFALDQSSGNIFFVMKTYNMPGGILHSFNVPRFTPNSGYLNLAFGETQAVLAVGNNGVGTSIYIATNNYIMRFKQEDSGSFTNTGFASVPTIINGISTALYVSPYLYFATYEALGKIARTSDNHFCSIWCGPFMFCTDNLCICMQGYSPVINGKPGDGCMLTTIITQIIQEKKVYTAAVIMGILFSISLIAALGGWVMWYKSKAAEAQKPLVPHHEQYDHL